jgi:hypothetical protein
MKKCQAQIGRGITSLGQIKTKMTWIGEILVPHIKAPAGGRLNKAEESLIRQTRA